MLVVARRTWLQSLASVHTHAKLNDLADGDTGFDLDCILRVIVSTNGIRHDELEAAVRAGQPIGEVRASDLEVRPLVVAEAEAPAAEA